jgi:hypothetical protein
MHHPGLYNLLEWFIKPQVGRFRRIVPGTGGTKAARAGEQPALMIVIGRLDLLGAFDLSGQLGRGMDQGRKTLGTDVGNVVHILQCHQRHLLFGLLAIQAGFHRYLFKFQSRIKGGISGT